MENETKSGGMGAIAGTIIIVALIIVAGWYFVGKRVERIPSNQEVSDIATGSSTEIEDIQTDLNNLDLKVLD